MATPTSDQKATGIIAYLTVIGLVIAILANNAKKSEYASYHIRNMIGISLLSTAITLLDWVGFLTLFTNILFIITGVFWVIGLVGAIRGDKLEIPVAGKFFQDWFKSI